MTALTGRLAPSALALREGGPDRPGRLFGGSGGSMAGKTAAKSRPALVRRAARSAQRVRAIS